MLEFSKIGCIVSSFEWDWYNVIKRFMQIKYNYDEIQMNRVVSQMKKSQQ